MKTNFNNLNYSEKNRILEMHKKHGYNMLIESPMDSMFYAGDDYTKDMGKSLEDFISDLKSNVFDKSLDFVGELANPEKILNNIKDFFGVDIGKLDKSAVENLVRKKFEGFIEKNDNLVKESEEQNKVDEFLEKVFGIDISNLGILGFNLWMFFSKTGNVIGTVVVGILTLIIIFVYNQIKKTISKKN